MAQHTNPGAIPLGARPLPLEGDNDDDLSLLDGIDVSHVTDKSRMRGVRRCRKCKNNYKPPRAHHDSVTGRCISKFDHFCPWVGNAVGALNHKFFVLFILYTFLTAIVSLFLLLVRFIRCGEMVNVDISGEDAASMSSSGSSTDASSGDTDDGLNSTRFLDEDTPTTFKYEDCHELYSPSVVVLLIMSICFMVFTCCMLIEQADAIESNTSKIARMKMRMGQDVDEYMKVAQDFNEMFGVGIGDRGANVGLHWFLPTPVKFPEGRLGKVLGYEFENSWDGGVYRESSASRVEKDAELGGVEFQTNPSDGVIARKGRGNNDNDVASCLEASDGESESEVVIDLQAGNGKSRRRRGTLTLRSSKRTDLESASISSHQSNQSLPQID